MTKSLRLALVAAAFAICAIAPSAASADTIPVGFDSTPALWDTSADASFSFAGEFDSEGDFALSCWLDGVPVGCTLGTEFFDLEPGEHTFRQRIEIGEDSGEASFT